MKIQFIARPISRTPLVVLERLYFYTKQYGLSVRQFTGQDQDYWKNLPARLRKAQYSPSELDKIIQELEMLAERHEERLQKRRSQLEKWNEKEIIINDQLVSILAALPEQLLAMTFKNITGAKDTPEAYRVVDLRIIGEKGENTDFLEPDLLLQGKNQLLMVEIKTKGGLTSSRNYPPKQLLNYIRLAVECQDYYDKGLPNQFAHLILVPSTDPKWLEKYEEWVLETSGENEGRMRINPDACLRLGKMDSYKKSDRISDLLEITPIYYRSWDKLTVAYNIAVEEFGDTRNEAHWKRIGNELKEITSRATKYAK